MTHTPGQLMIVRNSGGSISIGASPAPYTLPKTRMLDMVCGNQADAERIITRLQSLAKGMRGANRAELLAIVESLETLQNDTFHSSEYGLEELNSALKELS